MVAISADPFFNGIHFYFTHFTRKYEVCYILATFEKVSQKNVFFFFFFSTRALIQNVKDAALHCS